MINFLFFKQNLNFLFYERLNNKRTTKEQQKNNKRTTNRING